MNPNQLLDRFSSHIKNVIARAISIATSMQHETVTPLHILLAMTEEQGSIGAEIINKFNINNKQILNLLAQKPVKKDVWTKRGATATAVMPELNISSKKALEKAMLSAYENQHNYVGTEHLLLGIISAGDNDTKQILHLSKVNKKDIQEQINIVLQSTSHMPDMEEVADIMEQIQDFGSPVPLPPVANPSNSLPMKKSKPTLQQAQDKKQRTILELFTTDLTNKQVQKNIDPVIGRSKEIARVINILSRRTKNNPVLVGEPGVGKTAIVEGLAKKICERDVPDVLLSKKILSLDLTLLLAGTIYRGDFEARLKQIIDEVAANPNYILFIDEIHNIIGSGSNTGTMDAANILKPALARGSIRCIGATTIDEYKKYILSDPALERRFQDISVGEPTEAETLQILTGLKKYYEKFHNTIITEEAIQAAVELSSKYIHDYFLPDKAIDLIDEASAAVRVKQKSHPLDIEKQDLLDELESIQIQKEETIHAEKFSEAKKLKNQQDKLVKKIKQLDKQKSKARKIPRKKVTKQEVVQILSNKLSIAEKILSTNEWEQLETLADRLKEHIIGQDEVVDQVVQNLKQAHLGLKNKNKPFASLLFAGPSGVGKTELGKILAQELYHDDKALIKIDMSEFSEGHSSSKLLGSPAGYVGFKDRNYFIEAIKTRPYSVILFDEFDKAHASVRRLLLQILDEGELKDSTGKTIHFKHAIIILTTNLGSELFKSAAIGFGGTSDNQQIEKNVISKLKDEFGTELLSRISASCLFSPLRNQAVEQIVQKQISSISQELSRTKQVNINPDPSAIKILAKQSFSPDLGARNVENHVQKIIQELVIEVLQKKTRKQKYILKNTADVYRLV